MQKRVKQLVVFVFTLQITIVTSQNNRQKKDTIDTEVVNVVKPYTPKISDAFKVKETPTIDDEETATKKSIQYNIFSIPVASIFTPAKIKAAQVDKTEKEKLFDNYASLGVGTFTSILGELYLNESVNRSESFGAYINHHSALGDIEGSLVDSDFTDTRLNINYGGKQRNFSWNVDAGARQYNINWYGLPETFFNEANTSGIDPEQEYFSFTFGGEINFEDKWLQTGSIRFRRFADDFDSGENRFIANAAIDIPLVDNKVLNTTFKVDFIDGNFNQNFASADEINYGNTTFTTAPSYQIVKDDWTVNLGGTFSFLLNNEEGRNRFFIFPKVTATYRLVDEILISYGGIEGELIQNSYQGFVNENPFVSPTLNVLPTDQQYKVYVGLKGKLSNTMSYNVRANYYAENDRALFLSNPTLVGANQSFQNGNSFGVVYDDVDTFSIFGELNFDVNRNFNLGIKAEFFTYDTDDQPEAWNLPDFEASLFLDYQISKQWFAGANLFYFGERPVQTSSVDPVNLSLSIMSENLESFFDANAHLGYRINDQWTIYAKANNIANQDYERWVNFRVQSIQFLAGTTYKFDF